MSLKGKQKVGVSRLECVLDAIGFGGMVQTPSPDRSLSCARALPPSFSTLWSSRPRSENVIVHRMSIVDPRLVERSLRLELRVGDRVQVQE